jgi:hypothetical protein
MSSDDKNLPIIIFSEGTGVGGSVVKPTVKIKCKFCPRTFNGNIWYFLFENENLFHKNFVCIFLSLVITM